MSEDMFKHKKSLGQHFLNSDIVPAWMTEAADIAVGETVLEIGPGTGALTRALLDRGARVVAIEADARAVLSLEETFAQALDTEQLIIKHADARNLDLTTISEISDHTYKVVANIPYYLSGFLFRTFLESPVQPNTLVFLVQKEVAERICRDPKTSLLSLSVAAFGEPNYVQTVPRGHFTPPPKVASAIVKVGNISRDNFSAMESAHFFEVLHLGFGAKRKQLLGNLAKTYSREALTHIFSTLTLKLDVRAEDVSLKTWLLLAETLLSTPKQ